MDPSHPLRRHRRRPLYQLKRADPSTYLTTARLHLLQLLPKSHRLHSRTTFAGHLRPPHTAPPDNPRIPFTEAELAEIRSKRRYASDPDDVKYQLQDSKLVQMWNADYEHEEQWKEYDAARPAMEVKRDVAGLSEEMFQSDEVVGEKRRRISAVDGGEMASEEMVDGGTDVGSQELEEGEIDEGLHVRDTDGKYKRRKESLQKLREQNKALRTANDAMQVLAETLNKDEKEQGIDASPPSPPAVRSEKSSSSDDDSGDSDIAMCDFDLDDIDDEDIEDDNHDNDHEDEDEEDESGAGIPIYISSWLNKVDTDSQGSKPVLAMQDESDETQSGHELG